MKEFKSYLTEDIGKTLKDVKEIKYESNDPKKIISDFLNNLGLLQIRRPGVRDRMAVNLLKEIIQKYNIPVDNRVSGRDIYISGPISKHPHGNYHSFFLAEALLKAANCGFIVNPASNPHPENAGWADCMRTDLMRMFSETNTIVLIEKWETSLGAKVEKAVGVYAKEIKNAYLKVKKVIKEDNPLSVIETGIDVTILESPEFSNVLKMVQKEAGVSYEYITEIFIAKKVLDSIPKIDPTYMALDFTNMLQTTGQKIADVIKKDGEEIGKKLLKDIEKTIGVWSWSDSHFNNYLKEVWAE